MRDNGESSPGSVDGGQDADQNRGPGVALGRLPVDGFVQHENGSMGVDDRCVCYWAGGVLVLVRARWAR